MAQALFLAGLRLRFHGVYLARKFGYLGFMVVGLMEK